MARDAFELTSPSGELVLLAGDPTFRRWRFDRRFRWTLEVRDVVRVGSGMAELCRAMAETASWLRRCGVPEAATDDGLLFRLEGDER